jgi:tetratricopeptide (TPR) repeat protein
MSEKNEKLTFSDRTALFIQKYKIVLFVILAVAVIGLIGLLAYSLIQGGINNASARAMDDIREKYDAYTALADGDAKKTDSEKAIFDAIDTLAKKYPSLIAAQEALMLRANMASTKEDYKTAQDYYFKAYSTGKASFVAPFALKSAASMAENDNDLAKAIEYYGIIIKDYEDKMPGISFSYFNLGRLYEEQKNYSKANETFAKMAELFPIDSWTNLARSRIIYLKSQGLVP